MKTIDPMKPPTMVMYSEPPICALNICIPAKHTTTSVVDSNNDGPVDTPVNTSTLTELLVQLFSEYVHKAYKRELMIGLYFELRFNLVLVSLMTT